MDYDNRSSEFLERFYYSKHWRLVRFVIQSNCQSRHLKTKPTAHTWVKISYFQTIKKFWKRPIVLVHPSKIDRHRFHHSLSNVTSWDRKQARPTRKLMTEYTRYRGVDTGKMCSLKSYHDWWRRGIKWSDISKMSECSSFVPALDRLVFQREYFVVEHEAASGRRYKLADRIFYILNVLLCVTVYLVFK